MLLAEQSSTDALSQALGAVQTSLEYAGTVAFAISGALVAGRKQMDLVGVVVLGCIVAVGGGTTRDLLLGQTPVFWVSSPTFVLVAALTALATVPLHRAGAIQWTERNHIINLTDAAGLALFVVNGTGVALVAGASDPAAVLVGVITGVGGGLIRDLMANQIPDVLSNGQFYASAALLGGALYVLLLKRDIDPRAIFWIPILLIFGIRVVSLWRGFGVPTVVFDDDDEGGR